MIDTNTIKDRILSFAYQGKLVEPSQLSNDSIEAIHACIKGYIPVSEEEHLITIPKEWKWTRLGYVTSNHGQVTPSDTFSYIDVGTLDNVNHRLSFSENIVEAKDAPSRAKKVVEAGDVIYSTVRPYLHNICIIDKDFSYTPIASTAFCVMHANEEALDNKFLFYWLLTKEFDKYSNGDPSKGALYPAIGEKDLLKGVIPLPAVSEQKAIVAKIEAVFEIFDKIDALQDQYASNQEVLKSKLIDAAIQGKLTEQLPEDGTATDLLETVRASRDEAIKTGRIKKDTVIKSISPEEIPFDIPATWEWVRLGNIATILGGKRIPAGRKLTAEDTGHKYIRVSEMKDRSVITEGLLYVPEDIYPSIAQYIINKEDVYITVAGTIGRVGKIPAEIDGANLTENADRIVFFDLDQDWLIFCLSSSVVQKQIDMLTTQVAQPKLAIKKIQEFLIPLPPLNEQERIANKISAVLDLIP